MLFADVTPTRPDSISLGTIVLVSIVVFVALPIVVKILWAIGGLFAHPK